MSEKKGKSEKTRLTEGYQPMIKGYRPKKGNFDDSNPPQGGSGVPLKVSPCGSEVPLKVPQGGSGASSASSSGSVKADKKD